MFARIRNTVLLVALAIPVCRCQAQFVPEGPVSTSNIDRPAPSSLPAIGGQGPDFWFSMNQQRNRSQVQTPSGSVSALDIKAPAKARREYEKGYRLLARKDFNGAIEHFSKAISIYPDFVAAHNGLGSAYLDLGKPDQAREEFTRAVALDDHLPNSFLNLGCAELALNHYAAAEQAIQKASSMAPLDLQLATALAYAQLMNHDYPGAIATARQVHRGKHEGAAIVHYYAAAAWEAQNDQTQAERELQTLLLEDPKSPAAVQAKEILARFKDEEIAQQTPTAVRSHPQPTAASEHTVNDPMAASKFEQRQKQLLLQDSLEQKQVQEAESEPLCTTCSSDNTPYSTAANDRSQGSSEQAVIHGPTGWTLRSSVNEVAVLFAATNHGKSVPDLTEADVIIRDDQRPPMIVTGFRNESQLPLRLGIILDTSESVTGRFSFEQRSAINFLNKILTGKDDLAFVVGVANSVLLVQDFTNEPERISHAIAKLAPSGGTALWNAVAFGADKLASRPETGPVARMLVVISDGKDNSSNVSLKEAIESAERGEVFVYTVSTRDSLSGESGDSTGHSAPVGDHALKILADRTGGAAFVPGSLSGLNRGLDDLQEVIRGRYLISYKPAFFKSDGHYRSIEITAQKSGHKLRMYARKGYYASSNPASSAD